MGGYIFRLLIIILLNSLWNLLDLSIGLKIIPMLAGMGGVNSVLRNLCNNNSAVWRQDKVKRKYDLRSG